MACTGPDPDLLAASTTLECICLSYFLQLKSSGCVQAPDLGPPAPTLFDAVMELLDCPHPLDTLSEVTAYGPDGAISRFHNPDNYTRALGGVLRSRARSWRPLLGDPKPSSGKGKKGKGGGSGGDASDFQVGQGAAPTGGLWFLPPKGTTKVRM